MVISSPLPDIDDIALPVAGHEKQAGIGHVINVHEFPQRAPVPQTTTLSAPATLASWNFRSNAGSTWDVSRSKLSWGHRGWWACRDEGSAVLAVVGLAHGNAGDLGTA